MKTRISALITALTLCVQLLFAIPANAQEYLKLDYETTQDTVGWTSPNAAADMTVATDTNQAINHYFKFANSSGSGTRTAYYTFDAGAQATENQKSVIEFDFFMVNGGTENINQLVLLDSNSENPKGNANYSGESIFSFTQTNENPDTLVINSLDGTDDTYTAKCGGAAWVHAKAVMDFAEHSSTLKLTDLSEETVYFDNRIPMSATTATAIGKLLIAEARKAKSSAGIDNLVVRSYNEATDKDVYYTVTYNNDGVESTESVKESAFPIIIPKTNKPGFSFKGWAVNADTANLLSTERLSGYAITEDMTFTAVYEEDKSYIEPIVSAVINGPSLMTFGSGPDEAATNNYTLTIIGERGTVINSETVDSRVSDFKIEWDVDGFKTENDNEGQYCDSYGEFAVDSEADLDVSFLLKQVNFNFYGKMKATVTYNGTTREAFMYVIALGDKSTDNSAVLPEAGYPSDFDDYPESLVGYAAQKHTYGGDDFITGGWSMSGSDSLGNARIMNQDGNKFMRVQAGTSKKSHMFTNIIDVPEKQIIFEQNLRFNTAGGCVTLTSKQPFWSGDYTRPVILNFDGSTITLNDTTITKNDLPVTVDKEKWYKVVLSVDKTTKTCFTKIYDTDGTLVGETGSVAWVEESSPTYYSIGFANENTGSIDFDKYRAYYPRVDESTFTLISSKDTLSIPNKDTATLSASVKNSEGYDMTGAAEWRVLEDDMQTVIITPDELDTHKATVTLAEGAAAGEATVQVSIGGYIKTMVLHITDSAESVKFTESQGSVAIPLDASNIAEFKYTAAVINGDGVDLNRKITLKVYDKNNVNPYTLPNGVTFDTTSGMLKVTSEAIPCVFTIRATGINTAGESISRSVRVTIHGLSFDFGGGEEGSLAEGYTEVSPLTNYTESRGYGIEGNAVAGGAASTENTMKDYLSGDFIFKAKVTKGKVYRVTVAFSGDLVSEYVNEALSGHERTLEAENTSHTGYTVKTTDITEQTYEIPVVDDVLDLKFLGAKVAYISIEKIDKTPGAKPTMYSIGDSTLGNNGSYGYTLYRDQENYPELTELVAYRNNGKGSRNLKTYYTQGWLDSVLASIRPGDIVTVGNMGTNPGGMSGSEFKAPLEYYIDACIAMGAKVILTSYTPHGAVSGYEFAYDKETNTFHGCRQDAYDSLGIRVIYEERKYSSDILGFIDIGLNADNAFNAYVNDYEKNGYTCKEEAAQAIISCFPDHNHYNKGTVACELMLKGYGDVPGIVSEMVRVLTEEKEIYYAVKYDVDGNVTIEYVKENTFVSAIPDTEKAGYEFKGWTINDDTNVISTDELKSYVVSENITVKAVYEKLQGESCVKIIAEYDNDGVLVKVTVAPSNIAEAKEARRENNTLTMYWYSLEDMQPVIKQA